MLPFVFLFSLGCGITHKKFIVAGQCFNQNAKNVPWNQLNHLLLQILKYIPRATRLTVFPLKKEKNEVKENVLSLYIKAYFRLISNFFVDIFFKVLFFAIFNVFVELWWVPYRPILIYIFCFISICLYWKSIRSSVISEKLSPIYNKRLKKRTKENYFLLTLVVAFLISL